MRKAISMFGLLALLGAAISVAGVTTRASDKAMTAANRATSSGCIGDDR